MPSPQAQKSINQAMLKATKLTGVGKLLDATRLIQRTLFGAEPSRVSTTISTTISTSIPTSTPARPTPAPAANDPRADIAPPAVIILPAADGHQPPAAAKPGRKASFGKHAFAFEGDNYPYRLYIPAATGDAVGDLMPLVVLLHGCKQDALDFANGTAMNTLADKHNTMVLYPEQTTSGNAMRCWNWFDPSHQQAGRGEPGMIAALTQKVIDQHSADPARVYVAGLSAGGAMAALVSGLYPNLFAAVGVHSGLAAGAAQDVMSAFSAMRSGAKGHKTSALPTIVFHGTADTTVNPDNGEFITDAALAALKASGLSLTKTKSSIESSSTPGKPEQAERTVYSNASGTPFVESWRVMAGPHAWSGGNAQGSYTDPDGPDASGAMLAFFLRHKKGLAAAN
jgi:poly(hydroxyalkanoate) depolymerase family esterase